MFSGLAGRARSRPPRASLSRIPEEDCCGNGPARSPRGKERAVNRPEEEALAILSRLNYYCPGGGRANPADLLAVGPTDLRAGGAKWNSPRCGRALLEDVIFNHFSTTEHGSWMRGKFRGYLLWEKDWRSSL